MAAFKGINPEDIVSLSYRGNDPVGKTRIETLEGGSYEFNRRVSFYSQVALDRSFNTPRCAICINHTNELADISVGDAWLPETSKSRAGVSLLVARSQVGEDIVEGLSRVGRLQLDESKLEDLISSQGLDSVRGDSAYSLQALLAARGTPPPALRGFNFREAEVVVDRSLRKEYNSIKRKRLLQHERRFYRLLIRKLIFEGHIYCKRILKSRLIRRYLVGLFTRKVGLK